MAVRRRRFLRAGGSGRRALKINGTEGMSISDGAIELLEASASHIFHRPPTILALALGGMLILVVIVLGHVSARSFVHYSWSACLCEAKSFDALRLAC